MITLENISVSSYDLDSMNIYWEEGNASGENLSDYTVSIYRGETPKYNENDYELIASGILVEDYDYSDTGASNLRYEKWRELYYVLAPVYVSTQTLGALTTPKAMEQDVDLAAREIIRRTNLALRGNSHVFRPKVKILKKKSYGIQCTACFDLILGRRTEDGCEVCNDTGFVDGYYNPIEVSGMINASPKRTQITVWGEWQEGDAVLTITNYPRLAPQDVVVDRQNRRWVVEQVRPTEKALYTISQNARLTLVSRDDVIYNIDVESWS